MQLEKVFNLIGQSKVEYDKYKEILDTLFLPQQGKLLLEAIGLFYTTYGTDSINWEDFRTWFHVIYPAKMSATDHHIYDTILDSVVANQGSSDLVEKLHRLNLVREIQAICTGIENDDPNLSLDSIPAAIEKYTSSHAGLQGTPSHLVQMNVSDLISLVIQGHGIEWRVELLNQSVGQVHDSDFILIVKRPETGGTTFLTSEFTHMLHQLPPGKDAIIFNNEEGGNKVGLRVIQSALNLTSPEIALDPLGASSAYDQYLGGRNIYVYDKPGMSYRDINQVLKQLPSCWLIGINVLDKIVGFSKMEDTARYRKLAEWARNLAKEHGTVMAVAQADVSAEGKQYLDQSQVYGSKTGVQGEADVMIMIGCDPNVDKWRYFSVAKNKKPSTGRMQPHLRHGRFPVEFDGERGRFN